MFSIEKLDVWQESQIFAREIYTMVDQFPGIEEFGLKQQIKRASACISLNLAEGTGRTKDKEQANFYKYAFSSLLEVSSGIYLAKELGYIGPDDVIKLRPMIERIARQISALRNHTLNDQTNQNFQLLSIHYPSINHNPNLCNRNFKVC